MTVTQFGVNSNSTVKLWSERQYYDFVTDTQLLGQMIKAGVCRQQMELESDAGDRVRMSFLNRLTEKGLLGMQTASGLENPLVYSTDDLLIDQLRIPVAIPAPYTIDAQRVLYNLNEDTYRVTSEWMQVRGTLGILNQLAGNTATTITYDGVNYTGNDRLQVTGLNAAVAPSTTSGVTRIFRPNGDSTDQAVAADTTATAKLSDILACETIAATSRPYIRPLSETSGVKFHYYVHTQCYNDLINDTTSPWQYRDIQQSLITSGRGEGEIQRSFIFSQTRVFTSDKLPNGVDSGSSAAVANTRRNVFCGRDASGISFGRGYSDERSAVPGFQIKTDYYDIGNIQRIAMVGVFGISKLKFADQGSVNDNGVIVVTNYSSI